MNLSGTTAKSQPAPFEMGNWFPDHLALIQSRLGDIAARREQRPVAVFDFDNTCIFRDVGQAVFRFQLLHLRYRITPEQLHAILPSGEGELAGRPMSAVLEALLAAYRQLYPLLMQGHQAAAKELPEYPLFTTLLLWFTDQARKALHLGPRYVLPFMAKLLSGFTTGEVRQLAAEVVTAVGEEPLVDQTLAMEAAPPVGAISAQFPLGLHAHPEMVALMERLQKQQIVVYVVSASAEWLVEGAAAQLGFPVAPENIFGIRVGMDGAEVLNIADPEAYPVTFREGKAEIIRRFIGGQPVLVAGDADTDYEMLTLPGVDLRLLINRNQTGLVSTLYQDPRFLLQGLDQHTGRFRPFRESL